MDPRRVGHLEMHTQTVTQHYREDHQRLDEVFLRFQEVGEGDSREASGLFAEFKAGLERHIVWEEEILFPLFDAKVGDRPDSPTALMRWEHQHLRRYLARLERNRARHDTETELEQIVFFSLLSAHNHREEAILYPRMDEMLGEEERDRVFAEMGRTH